MVDEWNKENYEKYLEYLISCGEEEYRNFHKNLCNTKYEIIGIRLPKVRKIAKDIAKSDYQEFFTYSTNKYYEEVMIEGLVISHIKDEQEFFKYFKKFIKKIDNWAICDSFCNSLKIVKNNSDKYFDISLSLALDKKEYISRVGLIIILNFFVEKEYLDKIFKMLNEIDSDKYYVNMAQAWLICELFIKYPQETEEFLNENDLNKFTQNKAISKIRESYRVTKEVKDYLNTLKRK